MPRLAVFACAALLFVIGSLASAETPVKVLPTADPSLSSAKVRPSAVEWLMTGDYVTRLRWHRWGSERASATGTYHLNRCDPSCVRGPYKKMRGSLTLSHVVACRGVRLYTVASARYSSRGHWRKAEALGEPSNPCSP